MTEKHSYEIIVLDLDGTLTNRDKVITPKTKQRLMELQERGKKIVLASGRPTPGVLPLARELELAKYGVIFCRLRRQDHELQNRRDHIQPFPAAGGKSEDYTLGRGGTGGAFELR